MKLGPALHRYLDITTQIKSNRLRRLFWITATAARAWNQPGWSYHHDVEHGRRAQRSLGACERWLLAVQQLAPEGYEVTILKESGFE